MSDSMALMQKWSMTICIIYKMFGFVLVQIINVTNHTYGKVTIQWNSGNDKTFSIMPSTMDIPPLKSCAFQVTFKPVSNIKNTI
jgi:hypothetical protein